MKNIKAHYKLAVVLSVAFISAKVWNGFTRRLGSYYDPNETRHNAIVGSIIFTTVIALILYGLIWALRKKKLLAEIGWIIVGPALFMLVWDTITKNLVERGLISTGWLTDSAYLQEPGVRLHRSAWIFLGLLIALPFIYNLYTRFYQQGVNKR